MLCSCKALLLSVLSGQIGGRFPTPDPRLRIRYITKNSSIFKSVFKAQQIRKTAPKSSKKTTKNDPKIHLKRFPMEIQLLLYIPCENLDVEVPSIDISIQKSIEKMTRKQAQDKNENSRFLKSKI